MGRGAGRRRPLARALLGAALLVAPLALVPQAAGAGAALPPPADVLDGAVHGEAAITELGALLPAVASENGMTASELRAELRKDESLWVDETAQLFYREPVNNGPQPVTSPPAPEAADVFDLHSRPGSSKVIYLDFTGETIVGTAWNGFAGVPASFAAPAYSSDATPGSFSAGEQALIESVWARVAEDYAPFDVDVTTEDPGAAAIDRTNLADTTFGTKVVIAGTTSAYSALCAGGCGGKAYLGVFDEPAPTHAFYQPALVFQQGLGGAGAGAKTIAEAVSHEAGHNLGLQHDRTSSVDYYAGHGSWAPIMGVAYNRPISQWSRGEFTGSANNENDLAVITGNGLSVAADDHGNASSATVVPVSGSSASDTGIIERSDDADAFAVTVTAGEWTIVASPADVSPNLDIRLTVLDATNATIADSNPSAATASTDTATGLNATFTGALAAGTYRIVVQPIGFGAPATTGYSTYGSLGQYTVALTAGSSSLADVQVSAVSDPPASAAPGGSISITTTVENSGALTAPVSTLGFRLSLDAVASGDDHVSATTRAIPALTVGASSAGTSTVAIPASTASGTYRVLACADTTGAVVEDDESNNCTASNSSIVVTPGADLQVIAVGSPPASAIAGGTFAITTQVRNAGSTGAAASTTRFWLSTDLVVDGGDVAVVATRGNPALAAGASSSGSTTMAVPIDTASGSYRVIACADALNAVGEIDEANNCFAGTGTVAVSAATRDLEVTAVGSPPATVVSGFTFPLSSSVRNAGNVSAPTSAVGFALSDDATSGGGDIPLAATRSTGTLAAAATSSGTTTLLVPAGTDVGTYYVIVCADSASAIVETDESDNCTASATTVDVVDPSADLSITSLGNPPATALTGGALKPKTTVGNVGTATAGTSSVAYYLSADAVADAGDLDLTGTRAIPALTPSATSPGTPTLEIPGATPPGAYYVIACADVDDDVPEGNEANNCRSSTTTVLLSVPYVDLRLLSVASPPATALTGATLRLSTAVKNIGTGVAGATTVSYFLSADATYDGGDTSMTGTRAIASVNAGQTSTGNGTITVPSVDAGTYFIVACAGTVTPDVDGTNDCLASATSTAVSDPIAELRISRLGNPPATALTGGGLTPSTGVVNDGTGPSVPSVVRFYFSSDAVRGSDIAIADTRAVLALAPRASSTGTQLIKVPVGMTPGAYYLLACADDDDDNEESDETNNCRASTSTVAVSDPTPDLRISALGGVSSTAVTGGELKPSTTVQNSGTAMADASVTSYLLSTDSVADAGDEAIGTHAFPSIGAKLTSAATPTLVVPADLTPGSYRLLACADGADDVDEISEADNCRASSSAISIVAASVDLRFTALTNPPASRGAGSVLTVTSTVGNNGTVASPIGPAVEAWLSVDLTLGSDVALTGSRQLPVIAAKSTSAGAFTATIPAFATPAGSYYLVVCVDADDDVDESDETNNCRFSTSKVTITVSGGGAVNRL